MKQPISTRQLMALLFTAFSAPAVAVCAAQSWQSVLAASFLAVTVWGSLYYLRLQAGSRTMAQITEGVFGKIGGKILLAAQTLTLLAILWRIAPSAASAFPDSDVSPFVPVFLLLFCAAACYEGRRAITRAVAVSFFFIVMMYLAIVLFALPNMEPERLTETIVPENAIELCVLALPAVGVFLAEPQEGKRSLWWFLLFLLFPPIVAALCAAVPGSDGSFYQMAKSVVFLFSAQRIEPLVSVCLTVGRFAAVCLLALSGAQLLGTMKISPRPAAMLLCLAAIGGVFWRLPFRDGYLAISAAIFCVFLPLLTLLVDAVKFSQKKRK